MKLKNREEIQDRVEDIGLAVSSKLSSINFMVAKEFGIDGLLLAESRAIMVESILWSLLPFAQQGEAKLFEDQVKSLNDLIENFIMAARLLLEIKREDS